MYGKMLPFFLTLFTCLANNSVLAEERQTYAESPSREDVMNALISMQRLQLSAGRFCENVSQRGSTVGHFLADLMVSLDARSSNAIDITVRGDDDSDVWRVAVKFQRLAGEDQSAWGIVFWMPRDLRLPVPPRFECHVAG